MFHLFHHAKSSSKLATASFKTSFQKEVRTLSHMSVARKERIIDEIKALKAHLNTLEELVSSADEMPAAKVQKEQLADQITTVKKHHGKHESYETMKTKANPALMVVLGIILGNVIYGIENISETKELEKTREKIRSLDDNSQQLKSFHP